MDKSGIYTITNLLDNKIYVGYATNFRKRKGDHFANLNSNKHKNIHLQRAYNKYGKSNFICELIEECEVEYLTSLENYWSNLLDSHNPERGYNIRPTGIDILVSHSQETRNKISKSHLGKTKSKEHINKIKESKKGYITPNKTKELLKEQTYKFCKEGTFKLNEEKVKEIVVLLNQGKGCTEIAKQYNVTRHTIQNIKNGKSWFYVTNIKRK